MSAYVIGHIRVTDPDAWAAYRARVGQTIADWGGEVLLRGRLAEVLDGRHEADTVVVIRFPDAAAAAGWHASDAYQALVPLRRRGAEVTLLRFQADEA